MNRSSYALALLLVVVSAVVSALISSGITVAQSSRSQQTSGLTTVVQKWEYEIVSGTPMILTRRSQSSVVLSNPIARLNALGQQGYEVAGFMATSNENGEQIFTVLLKRAKP